MIGGRHIGRGIEQGRNASLLASADPLGPGDLSQRLVLVEKEQHPRVIADRPVEIGVGLYPDQLCPGQLHLRFISASVTLLENDFGTQAAGLRQAAECLIIAPSDAGRRGNRDRRCGPRRDHGRGNSQQAGDLRSRLLL